jgi:uncharacterized protein (DUF433 family)
VAEIDWREHIHSDPDIMGGKPVVRGSRITVELILEYFEDGATVQDVLIAFDHLTADDIRAAVAFAREAVATTNTLHEKKAA